MRSENQDNAFFFLGCNSGVERLIENKSFHNGLGDGFSFRSTKTAIFRYLSFIIFTLMVFKNFLKMIFNLFYLISIE